MNHSTGLESFYAVDEKNRKLRYGYTTGSCAAAAAKAAAYMLLSGQRQEEVALLTPRGILLHLLIEDIREGDGEVSCAVRKDGGDDPDATHGILIYARVKKQGQPSIAIDGGRGVGRVTKPGLNQPVGAAAINETPRRMIRENVQQICDQLGYAGGLSVVIEIPQGETIAEKTFNPRLGITGGLSVLGTSGIVVPMSEAALVESLRLEMKMLKAAGARCLVITPGNYGQTFSQKQKTVDLTYSMKCSNYVGETLDMARELEIGGILFIAHIGKFIKVAGGIMNTHSRSADCRAELMAAAAFRAGAPRQVVEQILDSNTTEESVDILAEAGYLEPAMEWVIGRISRYLNRRAGEKLEVGVILFSNVRGVLASTDNVARLTEQINHQNTQTGGTE